VQRRNQAGKQLLADATRLQLRHISAFFAPAVPDRPSSPIDKSYEVTGFRRDVTPDGDSAHLTDTLHISGYSRQLLAVLIDQLSGRLNTVPNARKAASEFKDVSLRDLFRLRAVQVYFTSVTSGHGRVKSSLLAAKVLGRGTLN